MRKSLGISQRIINEATCGGALLAAHLAAGLLVLGMRTGHRCSSDSAAVEIGTERTQRVDGASLASAEELWSPAVAVTAPVESEPDTTPPDEKEAVTQVNSATRSNAVEANPAPVEHLPFTEREEIASRYAATCSEKNVRLKLKLQDGASLRGIGSRYLFRLPDGQLFIFNEHGAVHDTNVRYSVAVLQSDVPPLVRQQARIRLGLADMRYLQIGLVMDNAVEVEMHRSLYDYLRASGLDQLQPNQVYQAEVSGASTLCFCWSNSSLIPNDSAR